MVAYASVSSRRFQDLVKSEPTLLFFRGAFLPAMMVEQRVTEEEVLAAARAQGIAAMSEVAAVVLETDGSFSVIGGSQGERLDTLRRVEGAERG